VQGSREPWLSNHNRSLRRMELNLKALAPARHRPHSLAGNAHSTPAIPRYLAAAGSPETATQTTGAQVSALLRSVQGLVHAVGLYQRNHPRVAESLEATERQLRALLAQMPELRVGVETGRLVYVSSETARPRPVADARGELGALAEALADARITSLAFLPGTNLGELALLAHAVDATRRAAGAHRRDRSGKPRDWSAWTAEHQITGIRINPPIERRGNGVLAGLIAALLGTESATALAAGEPFAATREQVRAALRFLAETAPRLDRSQHEAPQQAAAAVNAALAGAAPIVLALLLRGISFDPPQEGDTPALYLGRVADTLLLEFARGEYRAARTRADEVRWLLTALRAGPDDQEEEPRLEALLERFWNELPARETARVLAAGYGWCLPLPVLRRYLAPLTAAAGRGAKASAREAQRALADFARGVECEEEKARRATAAGLLELEDTLERVWPHPPLGNLTGLVIAALSRETSPGIAGLLAAVTELLSRLALARGAYGEFERILDRLHQIRRDAELGDIDTLTRRIVAQDRWLLLVDAALDNRPLDPVLPRLLRRDPERLIDRLGLLLTAPDGADALPAMVRLVRAAGEAVIGALETHLSEPRRQRAATSIKLLAGAEPERLAAALPRTLCAWDWSLQDLAVTELSRQPNPELRMRTARIFLGLLTEVHLLVVPGMLDHIALTGDESAVPRLVEIAAGDTEPLRDVFVRIKAIEALGRLRAAEAAPLLRVLVRNRAGLTYLEPAGLRSAAEEALALIENRPGSARLRQERETIDRASAPFSRPRRYLRVPLSSPLSARLEGARATSARVRSIALGGALLETSGRLAVGDSIRLEIQLGFGIVRPTAMVRSRDTAGYGVEFVHMSHKDRERLRRRLGRLQR
jgi:PilZ domain